MKKTSKKIKNSLRYKHFVFFNDSISGDLWIVYSNIQQVFQYVLYTRKYIQFFCVLCYIIQIIGCYHYFKVFSVGNKLNQRFFFSFYFLSAFYWKFTRVFLHPSVFVRYFYFILFCVFIFIRFFFQIKEKHVNEKHVLLIKNDIAEMIKLITE